MLYRIRFNKSRGEPGRGTPEHVWRVFDETDKEWLCKNVELFVPAWSQAEGNGHDWNIACKGAMVVIRETSTIRIVP